MTAKAIFERWYLVPGLGPFGARVNCPYAPTSPPLTRRLFLDFRAIFFQVDSLFFVSTIRQVIWPSLVTSCHGQESFNMNTWYEYTNLKKWKEQAEGLRRYNTLILARMGAQQSIMTEADDDNNNRMCCMPRNKSCDRENIISSGLGDAASRFRKWHERMNRQGRDSLQRPSVSFVDVDSVNHHLVSLRRCSDLIYISDFSSFNFLFKTANVYAWIVHDLISSRVQDVTRVCQQESALVATTPMSSRQQAEAFDANRKW